MKTSRGGWVMMMAAAGLALALFAPRAEAQVLATGGTIVRYRENGTNFIAHTFTNSDTLNFSSATNVEYLVVAGGGGGGASFQGAGGGAGGFLTGTTNVTATPHAITVGAGGRGRYADGIPPENGGNSSIGGGPLAYGGGRGADENYAAGAGGSGGGGSHGGGTTGGSGTNGQGHAGGNGASVDAGGGGGAGGAGQSPSGTPPRAGGVGKSSTLRNGTPVTYATGGGGHGRDGRGGSSAAANTGNGGEGYGGHYAGGDGGSGIVIVRYVDSESFDASVEATAGTAQWPFQSGAFTITRPADGGTNYEAVVSYTMSGTAVNGTDYSANSVANSSTVYPKPAPTALPGYVSFGVGVTSVVVNVYPLYNPSSAAKTATMTLNVAGNPSADVNFPVWWSSLTAVASTVDGTTTNHSENGTNYVVHIFTNATSAGTLTVTTGGTVEYLVVAGGGGGGGGYQGGGGGAGGLRYGSVTIPAGSYTVTVGAGGKGCRYSGANEGSSGSPSAIAAVGGLVVFGTTGGGRGSSENPNYAPDSGGSGGGGGYNGGRTGGAGTAGEGNVGGNCDNGDHLAVQGGGGGFTSRGQHQSEGGAGGAGTNLTYSGVSVTYAAGGNGAARATPTNGLSAAAYTGSGGNAGSATGGGGIGGNGGSGIVIVRHVEPPPRGTVIMIR